MRVQRSLGLEIQLEVGLHCSRHTLPWLALSCPAFLYFALPCFALLYSDPIFYALSLKRLKDRVGHDKTRLETGQESI